MRLRPRWATRGLTLFEVLVVIAIIAVLIVLLIPTGPNEARVNRIACVNNLKNIGLAMRLFASDHGTNFPMDLPATQGGTRELTGDSSRLWQQYLALTNELVTPKILWCFADTQRQPATTFDPNPTNRQAVVFTGNQHLSYFLGLNATEAQPQTILAGDRNVTTNGVALGSGRHVIAAGTQLGFTDRIHKNAGNLLLGDGSVHHVTSGQLTVKFRAALTNSGLATNVWIVP